MVMNTGESDRSFRIAGFRLRHAQLVEEEGEDVGIFRDALGEGGAHAVARGRAEMHENRVGGGVGLLGLCFLREALKEPLGRTGGRGNGGWCVPDRTRPLGSGV